MKPLFKKVAIVGIGLIGGSIALEIKKRRLASKIVGISRHRKSILKALKIGAIDEGALKLDCINGADLLIIATPVGNILKSGPELLKHINKNCLVTDVGSTKGSIVNSMEKLFPNYVGSHPLAGSEKRGILNAQKNLFARSVCVLTPTDKTNPAALRRVVSFWRFLGAKTMVLNPQEHDKSLCFASHLPHLIAFSLVNAIPTPYFKLGAGGLKDTTRIAASDHILWSDIFLANRSNILKAISVFEKRLKELKTAIKNKNDKLLKKLILESRKKREALK